MIAHEAKGMNLPGGLTARLSQGFEEILPVDVVEEDVIALVPPAHHVIHRARVFYSKFAWHGSGMAEANAGSRHKMGRFYGLTRMAL